MKFAKLLIIAAALLNFACAKQYDLAVSVDSPFAKSKVVMSEKAFDQEAPGGEPTLKPETQLIAKIHNGCARDKCASDPDKLSITCQAYAPHEALQDTFQAYYITAPQLFTERDLKAWVNINEIDRDCIEGVTEEIHYQQSLSYNDTNYAAQQTNLNLIRYEAALSMFAPSTMDAVKVGVIDTGIAADSDLQVFGRSSFSTSTVAGGSANPLFAGDDQTKPNNFHGTFVAGIIGATQNNADKIAGIASNAHLYAFGVGNSQGSMSNLEIANAIQAAVSQGMEVVNMSFGTSSGGGTDDPLVRDGILAGYVHNTIFVAAAGNSNIDLSKNSGVYPAQYSSIYDNVISVAASDTNGFRASFSNYAGPTNIMAPGTNVYSIQAANLGGGVITSNGTSFASPIVAAAVAMVVGNLKHRAIPIDVKAVRNLVTVTGANQRTDLNGIVLNGAFLDLYLLGKALPAISNQTALQGSVARGTDANGQGTVQVTVTWNTSQVSGVTAGSNIGIFDLTGGCDYEASCLITSIAWPATGATCDGSGNCSLLVTLTRAQVIAMMSGKGDPTAALPLGIAIYHVATDPSTGKPMRVYPTDYTVIKDIRSLNGNTGEAIIGVVDNFRMDMKYLYIQGWACRPKSEEALSVGLVDSGGSPITTDFGYDYPYMVPHGSPIDGGDFADWGFNIDYTNQNYTTFPHSKAYMAQGIDVLQKRHNTYSSGIEGNATLIIPCGTLTASHGYEIVVPLSQIRSGNLSGTTFTVQTAGGMNLTDADGNSTFTFPDLPADSGTAPNLTVNRAPASLDLGGTICSTSPSPVVAEISYSTYAYVYALTGKIPFVASEGGLVNDPTLTPTTPLPLPIQTVDATQTHDMTLKFSKDTLKATDTSDAFTVAYLGYQPNPVPNTSVFGPSIFDSTTDAELATWAANVNAKNYVEIQYGLPLSYYKQRGATNTAGSALTSLVTSQYDTAVTKNYYSSSHFYNPYMQWWDYYDVGDAFSTVLIGYPLINDYSQVASTVNQTYQVQTVLREVKKFETPVGMNTAILANKNLSMTSSTACGAGAYQHTLPTWTLASPKDSSMYYYSGASGFWPKGNGPINVTSTTVESAMVNVPLTVRFFQDGKMILHVESDTASTFYQVPYTF